MLFFLFFFYLFFFSSFYIRHLFKSLRCHQGKMEKSFHTFQLSSSKRPFKEMTAGTSSGGPVSATKENTPLFWSGLLNYPFAALHPTKTTRMIPEYGMVLILLFLHLMWWKKHAFRELIPCQGTIICLPHQRVCNGEFETSVHEKCKQASSIFGII